MKINAMDTYRDRYQNDPEFRQLVDVLTSFIVECQFTPSEMRASAVLASILYHETHVAPTMRLRLPQLELEKALGVIESFVDSAEPI